MAPGVRAACAAILSAAGCWLTAGCAVTGTGADPGEPLDPRVTAALSSYQPLLETLEWSELDGLVTVVARNNSDRVLTGAQARLTVLDSGGAVLEPDDESDQASVLAADVAPGASYAFTLDLGEGADVDRVEAEFTDLSWAPGPVTADTGRVSLEPAVLTANGTGAVVGARAVTSGGPVPSVIVQARLQASDGRLVAVATTTAECLDPRVQRRVWLQLDRHAPAGTTLGPVTAFPRTAPDLGGAVPSPDC